MLLTFLPANPRIYFVMSSPVPEQLCDPAYAFEAGQAFAERLGVYYDPLEQPQAYDEAMLAANPRTAKQMLRYELERSTTEWSAEDVALIDRTAVDLGIKTEEYPFTPGAEYDLVIVAGGARNAMPDRAEYLAQAQKSGLIAVKRVVVIGDPRDIPEGEQRFVATWAPGIKKGFDMATATVAKMRRDHAELYGEQDDRLDVLTLQTAKPDQRSAVTEAILREGVHATGRIAVVTTALYVPFKTHKSLAAARPLGVHVDVIGAPSRPEVIAARTVDTYFSENAQTLMSAAQHLAATRRL